LYRHKGHRAAVDVRSPDLGPSHAFWPNAEFSVGVAMPSKSSQAPARRAPKAVKDAIALKICFDLGASLWEARRHIVLFDVARDVAEFIEKSLYFF